MSRRGMTLLELLAALGLLSLTIAAASGWLVGVARTEARLRDGAAERAWVGRAADLLRRDLRQAWPGSVEIDPARGLITAFSPDGNSTDHGWKRIEWSRDTETGTLRRRERRPAPNSPADARDVLAGATGWLIEQHDPDGTGDRAHAPAPGYAVTITLGQTTETVIWRPSP